MDMPSAPARHRKDDFLRSVATIVLAGGQGTRLFPLTLTRCKPAVSFGGHYRLIDIPISNSLNARVNQIFVISQYFASDLHQHILTTYQFDAFHSGKLELLTPQETSKGKAWFNGTADAVRQTWDLLSRSTAEWFLILSGDQLYNMDLLEMLAFAKQHDADLTIASIPLPEQDAKRMGVLQLGGHSQILDFVEKPKDPKVLHSFLLSPEFLKENGTKTGQASYLCSMGIYIFKRSALMQILKLEGDDFGKDLIPKYIKKGKSHAFIYRGYWEDIGTIASYYQANLLLTQGEGLNTYVEDNQIYSAPQHIPSALIQGTRVTDSLISSGGIIEAEEITHSVVGVRALIKKGTVIRDSIIMGNRSYHPFFDYERPGDQYFSIGENCHIEKAIIDEEVRIGDHVQLINKDGLNEYDGDGIYIRDGIIIVTSGTEVPDHFVL